MVLCERGVRAAKRKYAVYPSAYANGYAAQVCRGTKPDLDGNYRKSSDGKPPKSVSMSSSPSMSMSSSGLKRWYEEKWVNVCAKTVSGTYPPCGGRSSASASSYPYCRPTKRVSASTPATVSELLKSSGRSGLEARCRGKRSLEKSRSRSPSGSRESREEEQQRKRKQQSRAPNFYRPRHGDEK